MARALVFRDARGFHVNFCEEGQGPPAEDDREFIFSCEGEDLGAAERNAREEGKRRGIPAICGLYRQDRDRKIPVIVCDDRGSTWDFMAAAGEADTAIVSRFIAERTEELLELEVNLWKLHLKG